MERDRTDEFEQLLEVRLAKLTWRLDAIDDWREKVDGRMTIMVDSIEQLSKADEIARAVAAELGKRTSVRLTFWQKIGAVFAGVLIGLDALSKLLP